MWASTPTNALRFRIGAFVFAGAYCRADRVVRPYGCVPLRIGAPVSATLYGAGEVEPLPYAAGVNLLLQPIIDARRNIAERIIHGASAVEQRGVDLLERMDDRRVIAPELAPNLRQRQIRHLAN